MRKCISVFNKRPVLFLEKSSSYSTIIKSFFSYVTKYSVTLKLHSNLNKTTQCVCRKLYLNQTGRKTELKLFVLKPNFSTILFQPGIPKRPEAPVHKARGPECCGSVPLSWVTQAMGCRLYK